MFLSCFLIKELEKLGYPEMPLGALLCGNLQVDHWLNKPFIIIIIIMGLWGAYPPGEWSVVAGVSVGKEPWREQGTSPYL